MRSSSSNLKPTAQFEIRFLPSVRKDLRGIPKPTVKRILEAVDRLATNPRPSECKKLTGHALFRIRVGVYRVVYEIRGDELIVVVVKVGHRRDVYD